MALVEQAAQGVVVPALDEGLGILAGVLLALASHEGLNALADDLETSGQLPYPQNLYPYRGDAQSLPDAKSALETVWPEH